MRRGTLGILAGAEAATLLLLLLASAWQFWGWAGPAPVDELRSAEATASESLSERMPSFGGSEVMLALLIAAAAYGALQFVGRSSLAIWMAATLTLAPQVPAVWGHNSLAWERFTGATTTIGDGHAAFLAGGLFLVSLLGLFVLHRLIAMRTLDQLLARRRVDDPERISTLANEATSLAGIVGVAGLLALALVTAGTLLGRWESLTSFVPWTIATIGIGASLLLLVFVATFMRGVAGQGHEDGRPTEGD